MHNTSDIYQVKDARIGFMEVRGYGVNRHIFRWGKQCKSIFSWGHQTSRPTKVIVFVKFILSVLFLLQLHLEECLGYFTQTHFIHQVVCTVPAEFTLVLFPLGSRPGLDAKVYMLLCAFGKHIQCVQALCKCLIWVWEAVWGGCQPQTWHNRIIMTPQVTQNPQIWAK